MNERNFQMRMFSKYEESENTVTELEVELWEDEEWRTFDLNVRSPGFLIFVYADFTCQHLYLRTNAAERGLILESSRGSIHVVTSEDWDLEKVHVSFDAKLASGSATPEDFDYIIGRMKQCPVSKNLSKEATMETVLHFR